jgi:hypothetical protein
LVEGEKFNLDDVPNRYRPEVVYRRFLNIMRDVSTKPTLGEEGETERKYPEHGTEIWGLGYMTSDHSEDEDE